MITKIQKQKTKKPTLAKKKESAQPNSNLD